METETKKKVLLGDTGNRADVVEEDRNAYSPGAQHSKQLVGNAGKLHTPLGADYIGSAVVHYYKKDGLTGPMFMVVCQADVTHVLEHHADLGWKQLRACLQKAFGRPEPKMRN